MDALSNWHSGSDEYLNDLSIYFCSMQVISITFDLPKNHHVGSV